MLHVVSVWIHVLAAAVWIGGAAFLALVAMPVMRRQLAPSQTYCDLLEALVRRFRAVAWGAFAVLIVTGFVQIATHGFGAMLSGRTGAILSVKLTLVAVAFGLSAIHDFSVGPRALEAMRSDLGSEHTERLRKLAGWIGRLTFLLALSIVALAVMLFRAPF